jgi:hypothetical protein
MLAELTPVKAELAIGGSMAIMSVAARTIPIQPAQPSPGCGRCMSDGQGERLCGVVLDRCEAAPELSGPPDQVSRVLSALVARTGCAPDGSGLVRRLLLREGEADLQLSVASHCGGVALADGAFQALRGLLPDPDIFVTFAAA